jgi:solute carrier family 25 (mitochondrial carnitine/acylcarnitine transporter), member 20/29
LTPPSDPLQTALPRLDLSSFLAAVFSTSLAETLKTTPRTTLLIPHNGAFKRIGQLVSEHLLSASSKPELERLILHHTIDGVEYASELLNGSLHSYPTLEGSDISIFREPNGSIFVGASGGWADTRAALSPYNRLTRTGVIHELTDLLLPRSIELTVGKLMRAAKGATMTSLVARVGMDWILNGTNPPDDPQWAGMSGVGWTLLCPTDEAFKDVNLTTLYADLAGMRDIVRQHLIPSASLDDRSAFDVLDGSSNMPVPIDSGATFSTLLTASSPYGDVVFRATDDSGYVVGIKGARGTNGKADWARVMAWGRSTTGHGTGGVIQIDRLLVPYYPPWWILYGGPVAVLLGGMVLICLFFYVVSLIWRRDTTEATYEPMGGFGRDDED